MEMRHLAGFWIVVVTRSVFAFGDVKFLDRFKGESVVLPCVSDLNDSKPIGLSLKRKQIRPDEVLFMYTLTPPTISEKYGNHRFRVTGDPSNSQVNVTISQLRGSDTDLYYCEFVFLRSTVDLKSPGRTEFILYVNDTDAAGSVDVGVLETCVGGAVVLPCLAPHGKAAATEGVCLKRRQGRAQVEVLFHSKHPNTTHLSTSSQFPPERLSLHLGTSPSGLAYNLTLLHLQPEDTGFYSCELLLPDRPNTSSMLGRHAYFVFVQGGHCSCSSYATLLYATSAAVGLLLLLLAVMAVVYCGQARHRVKPQAGFEIYEEMVGVRPPKRKSVSHHFMSPHLEEMDTSGPDDTFRPENHYESPQGSPLVPEKREAA